MNKEEKDLEKSRLKDLKLSMLLEITKGINNNISSSSLFEIFESVLQKPLNIGRAILFHKTSEDWVCQMKFGVDRNVLDKINISKDLLPIQEIKVVESPVKEAGISFFDVVIPIYHKQEPLAFLLLGDINEDAMNISPIIKHLPFIQTLSNIILVSVENKRLYKENLHRERLKRELELASEMQSMLFPTELPENNFLDLEARYKPHFDVGGDYYDFIEINKNEVVFCVADVSGKGVSAALLMANFQANLRALVKYVSSLEIVIIELNNRVLETAKGEKFVTLFLAKYYKKERVLEYINAAHYPPILFSNNTIKHLDIGCTGIGMLDELPAIDKGKIPISKGDILVCYTDGIVDLENEMGQEFDIKAIESIIQHDQYNKTSAEINKEILRLLEQHKGNMPYVDDIALLTCKFI